VQAPALVAWLPTAGELALAALVAGSLYALNGWDYPTQLGIGLLCLLLWVTRAAAAPRPRAAGLWALAWVAASFALFLPFSVHFSAPARGLGPVREHSSLVQFLHDYLLLYGLPVWVLGAAYAWRLRQRRVAPRYLVWAAILAAALLALLAPSHLDGLLLLLAALALALPPALDEEQAQPYRVFWLLAAVAIGLATIGEVVYVRDAFDGGVDYRMNTVFKFGYQAWFLFAVVAGCGVFWSRRWLRPETRPLWLGGLAVLAAFAAVYPVAGTYAREGAFTGRPTLDGLRWLELSAPGDAAAIRWLQAHVRGAPTILEAVGQQYDPAGHARVSTFTGLPAVLGWAGHEAEWAHDVGTRPDDVKTIYVTPDAGLARALLARYGVRYVFVGSLERADFPPAGLAKFAQLGTPVFSERGIVVYEIH
jgi:YYY domain-containing protein